MTFLEELLLILVFFAVFICIIGGIALIINIIYINVFKKNKPIESETTNMLL